MPTVTNACNNKYLLFYEGRSACTVCILKQNNTIYLKITTNLLLSSKRFIKIVWPNYGSQTAINRFLIVFHKQTKKYQCIITSERDYSSFWNNKYIRGPYCLRKYLQTLWYDLCICTGRYRLGSSLIIFSSFLFVRSLVTNDINRNQ